MSLVNMTQRTPQRKANGLLGLNLSIGFLLIFAFKCPH